MGVPSVCPPPVRVARLACSFALSDATGACGVMDDGELIVDLRSVGEGGPPADDAMVGAVGCHDFTPAPSEVSIVIVSACTDWVRPPGLETD